MRCALSSELLGAGVRHQEPPAAIFATVREEPKENGKHTEERRANREIKEDDIFIRLPSPRSPPNQPCWTFPGLFGSFSFLSQLELGFFPLHKRKKEKKNPLNILSFLPQLSFQNLEI